MGAAGASAWALAEAADHGTMPGAAVTDRLATLRLTGIKATAARAVAARAARESSTRGTGGIQFRRRAKSKRPAPGRTSISSSLVLKSLYFMGIA
jgi:hypothetical protein